MKTEKKYKKTGKNFIIKEYDVEDNLVTALIEFRLHDSWHKEKFKTIAAKYCNASPNNRDLPIYKFYFEPKVFFEAFLITPLVLKGIRKLKNVA